MHETNSLKEYDSTNAYYSCSRKSKQQLLHRTEKEFETSAVKYGKKIKDVLKFYLKKCMSLPKSGMSQTHIQLICDQLKNQDQLRFAVRVELALPSSEESGKRAKYIAIITKAESPGESFSRNAIFGFDLAENELTTIGISFPIVNGVKLSFYGDGKLMIFSPSDNFSYVFRPVSVQAMWYCFQSLERVIFDSDSNSSNYWKMDQNGTIEWTNSYKFSSSEVLLTEWKTFPDQEFEHTLASSPMIRAIVADELSETEQIILSALRDLIPLFDLDDITPKALRLAVQEHIGLDNPIQLTQLKSTFDKLMMFTCNQAEAPSRIFDHVYLGNEGNATNRDEMKKLGITHVLNISNEIDNLFPHDFEYMKLQVDDEPTVDLMKHWQTMTNKFIESAKNKKGKILVHCKMGKSRSAATVVAYAMKTKGWTDIEALEFVKTKRPVICPNQGFLGQLHIYSGILEANRHKINPLWSGSSVEDDGRNTGIERTRKENVKRVKSLDCNVSRARLANLAVSSHVRRTKEKFESGVFDFCFQVPIDSKLQSAMKGKFNSTIGKNAGNLLSSKPKQPLAFRNSINVQYWDKSPKNSIDEDSEAQRGSENEVLEDVQKLTSGVVKKRTSEILSWIDGQRRSRPVNQTITWNGSEYHCIEDKCLNTSNAHIKSSDPNIAKNLSGIQFLIDFFNHLGAKFES
ncbi:protein phosphatase Slingshot homolog 3-like isoform X3 [Symsagittifera roscoffensis]|uniref:protein phosphatase Slingshot homolog 3-like isoform X3 n=1 Tax=Symsagittifera roscoffensis TaxID=84072 RepID=UPI00307B8D38